MARLSLNKSSLAKEQRQLKTYQQFLPSLDLKRRQLIAERAKAQRTLADIRHRINAFEADTIGAALPMLAYEQVNLDGLVQVVGVDLGEENIVGTRLPVLREVHIQVQDYALLARPHWVDTLVERLREALELRLAEQVAQERLALLETAVRIITQRVNLFDKVLIPQAKHNIKKIKIYLGDQDRAAVVRAKIAKAKLGGPAAS